MALVVQARRLFGMDPAFRRKAQLVVGHAEGFVRRVAASVIGAFVVMGLIGVGLGLASLFAG